MIHKQTNFMGELDNDNDLLRSQTNDKLIEKIKTIQ